MVGLAVVVWGVMIGVQAFRDNSFMTHLATGRLILDGGGVPGSDPYSWSAPGASWTVQSWLASVAYAWSESWWGLDGVRWLMGVLTGAVAALAWTLTRPARSLVPRVVLVGLVAGIGTGLWLERPLLIGLVILGLVLLAAEGRLHPAWLVPALWVWTNAHGSYPLALVVLATLAAGRRLDGEDARIEVRALAFAAGGVALGAIGPLGTRVFTFPVELLSRQDVLSTIVEWQAPGFVRPAERLFLALLLVGVLLIARRPSWRLALPFVVFAAAALLGSRNIPVASLVVLPLLSRAAADLGEVDGSRRGPLTAGAAAAVAVLGLAAVPGQLGEPGFNLAGYPARAMEWADQNRLLDDERVVTRDFGGNYLEVVYGPAVPVFIDDRFDMYPPGLIEDYRDLLDGTSRWQDVLDSHGADVVVWDREQPLSSLLVTSPEWMVDYSDHEWLVATRR